MRILNNKEKTTKFNLPSKRKEYKMIKTKKGVASFYIIAFSTLILMVIVASFTALIVSEIEKTSNDDLSQSAYDSAMAGVEDAKLAYYKYQECLSSPNNTKTAPTNQGDSASCGNIIWYMETTESEYEEMGLNRCDMVKTILGKESDIIEYAEHGTSNPDNNLQQEYTCAKITQPTDYESTIGSGETMVIPIKMEDSNAANSMFFHWRANEQENYTDVSKTTFPNTPSIPPAISIGLIQTATEFKLSDFNSSANEQTNRGTVFLVPTNSDPAKDETRYIIAENNIIGKESFLNSNSHSSKNLPYIVKCGDDGNCSATLHLPRPIGDTRNDDTFMLIFSVPYGNSTVTYSFGFCTNSDGECVSSQNFSGELNNNDPTTAGFGSLSQEENHEIPLKNMQIKVDSTGRANDLYRRTSVRLNLNKNIEYNITDLSDSQLPFPLYALELLGSGDGIITMPSEVTSEYNF